jgi:hypothetical protein
MDFILPVRIPYFTYNAGINLGNISLITFEGQVTMFAMDVLK